MESSGVDGDGCYIWLCFLSLQFSRVWNDLTEDLLDKGFSMGELVHIRST